MYKLQVHSDIDLEQLTLHWQFDLKTGLFNSDEDLIKILNPGKNSLALPQLFAAFDRRRVNELKRAFKSVIDAKELYSTAILINISDKRYLVNLSFDYTQNKQNIIIGKIVFLIAFPSVDEEDELVKILFNRASHAILIADKNHVIIKANELFLKNSGYLQDELIGKRANILKSGQYTKEFYQKLWQIVDTERYWAGEILLKSKQGDIYAHDIKIQRIELSQNNYFYIAESKKLDYSTQILANNPLDLRLSQNCVLSKENFIEKMNEKFSTLVKNDTIVVAAFNVTLLQKVSDSMLKWLISQRFSESNSTGYIGEISNDIFIGMWVVEKSADKVNSLIQNMLSILSGGAQASELDFISIIHMGVSVLSIDAKTTQQLITHSVQTLITNPNQNASSINYFDPRLSKRFNKRKTLSRLLYKALQDDQLEVYYQPIADIKSMCIVKFEALMRITLDTEIEYNTQELIEIAEQYGWIDKIDTAVSHIALRDIKKIRQHYLIDDIGITINRSLSNDKISNCCLKDTLKLLTSTDIDLNTVTIELTESALFDNLNRQRIWVEKIRALGASVALDDFGTGYSSFTYLNKLPVNIVKIDRSFVTDITLNSNEYMMIEMLCRLTHKMGGKVIAEGIENENELLLLSRAKVDMLQGYIFSKPMSLKSILNSPRNPIKPELLDLCFKPLNIIANEIMCTDFFTISSDQRLLEAKQIFSNNSIEFLLVLEKNKCIGILTRANLDKALSPYLDTQSEQHRDLLTLEKRIHQVINKTFYAFEETSLVLEIEQVLLEEANEIIVLNDDLGHCSGVITAKDILNHHYRCSIEAL
jgi:PAS domain S-box-containing protein